MRNALATAAIIAGIFGFFGTRATFVAPTPDIMVSMFILLCSLLSIGLGIVAWRAKGKVLNYTPLLFTAAVAGAALGSALVALVLT